MNVCHAAVQGLNGVLVPVARAVQAKLGASRSGHLEGKVCFPPSKAGQSDVDEAVKPAPPFQRLIAAESPTL